MRVIALMKCWGGEEWLPASVDSIIGHVDKVVISLSSRSWIGGMNNPSAPVVDELMARYPGKVVSIPTSTTDQLKQVEASYRYACKAFSPDRVMLIDSDEVWDDYALAEAIEYIEDNPGHQAYRVNLHSYIRSPFYRTNHEPCCPVAFVSPGIRRFSDNFRCCHLPYETIPVRAHHFVFVRLTFNAVLEKIVQSHTSEGQAYQDMSRWIPEVWNKLPNYNRDEFPIGFHPNVDFQANYQGVQVVGPADLPAVLSRPEYAHLLEVGR